MITRLNVASIYVLDKDEALDFYVNKLGLEKGNDVRQGDYRWLTVRVPGRAGHRDLAGAAGPAAARRGHRGAAPRAHHQGRAGRPRLHHRRRPRPVRDPQGARRHRLHPGAHRPLLRHRHGHPRPVRQPDPDPPAGKGRRRRRRPEHGRKEDRDASTSDQAVQLARRQRLTDEERAAMQESARERKARLPPRPGQRASRGRARTSARGSPRCRQTERAMAERSTRSSATAAPALVPKTYYGMPAYDQGRQDICFFQPPSKFKVRYWTLGFQPEATPRRWRHVAERLCADQADPEVEARSPSS